MSKAGRKQKRSVEFFPHFIVPGKTLFTLEKMFGNDGYSTLFKTLELLGGQDEHYYDFSAEDDWFYICAKMNLEEDRAEKIFTMMVKLRFLDKNLYEKKIIWCQNFVDNLLPLYRKRTAELPTAPISAPETPIPAPETPHSKVKESKGEKDFSSDSEEFRLSNLLLSKILLRNPEHKKPDLGKWSKQIDYMIRLDNRDPQKIANVIDWAQNDSFWMNNILSTSKLREKFDDLVLKMISPTKVTAPDGRIKPSTYKQQQMEELSQMLEASEAHDDLIRQDAKNINQDVRSLPGSATQPEDTEKPF